MATTKLFPPSLDPKLPAFAGNELRVPFLMNRTVGSGDAHGARIMVKTVSTGKTLGIVDAIWGNNGPTYDLKTGQCSVSFDVSNLNLVAGQYYKIQIAYLNNDEEPGYFSSVGVIKKISTPILSILNTEKKTLNNFNYSGKYSQAGGDESEKVYSYCFDLYDYDGNLVKTSGVQLHHNENDETYESIDTWRSGYDLIKDTPYSLTYTITTINGYTDSYTANIEAVSSVDLDADIALYSELNYEDGSIILSLAPKLESTAVITGDFVMLRSCKSENYASWDEVYRFSYKNIELSKNKPEPVWEDTFIQQGESYRYAIQAYNEYDFYSNKIYTVNDDITADFEYCFLTDSQRQLKIAFNAQVSNFKNTIQESKVETMGSRYPFIFRNGNVKYKEFSIGGLLSLISDDNGKFIKKDENSVNGDEGTKRTTTPGLGTSATDKTSLSSENIYNERLFKLEVLEWLNNGELKVFRSPTEGNFIVQLMNVSLTPNETLGRMLHTFTCTAYEMAEFSFANLLKNNMINISSSKVPTLRIGQICPELFYINPNTGKLYPNSTIKTRLKNLYPWCTFADTKMKILRLPDCYSLNITDANPGTIIKIHFSNSTETIEIGGTGAYYVKMAKKPMALGNISIIGIEMVSEDLTDWGTAKITFEYYDNKANSMFSNIIDISSDYEIRRFVGPGVNENLIKNSGSAANNYILSDIRREIGEIIFLRAEKRYVEEIYRIDDKTFARNKSKTDIIQEHEWNPLNIYHYKDSNNRDRYLNGHYSKLMDKAPDFRFYLNDNNSYIDLGGTGKDPAPENIDTKYEGTFGRIELTAGMDNVQILRVGSGVLLDIAYQVRTKLFAVEALQSVSGLKDTWKSECDTLAELFKTPNATQADFDAVNGRISMAYAAYIEALKTALDKELSSK